MARAVVDVPSERSGGGRCGPRSHFRELVTRYAERAAHYRAELVVVAIVLWLRTGSQDTP